jgi:hypothetical protein
MIKVAKVAKAASFFVISPSRADSLELTAQQRLTHLG